MLDPLVRRQADHRDLVVAARGGRMDRRAAAIVDDDDVERRGILGQRGQASGDALLVVEDGQQDAAARSRAATHVGAPPVAGEWLRAIDRGASR
jgi:hypothetical protein